MICHLTNTLRVIGTSDLPGLQFLLLSTEVLCLLHNSVQSLRDVSVANQQGFLLFLENVCPKDELVHWINARCYC